MTEPVMPLVDDTTAVEALHERLRELEHALSLDARGKVVVVKLAEGREPGPEVADLAGRLMNDAGASMVLVVRDGHVDLDVLDDEQMARNGWQRIPEPEPHPPHCAFCGVHLRPDGAGYDDSTTCASQDPGIEHKAATDD